MRLREWLNQNSSATVIAVAVLVVLAVALVVMQVLGSRRTFADKLPDAFFTIDDGKTFFAASSENVPPFDYKGQPAVRAYVFRCPKGEQFVGYMERYIPEARKAVIDNKATPQTQIYGRELKKTGGPWVRSGGDPAAVAQVTEVRCPNGHDGEPEPVEP